MSVPALSVVLAAPGSWESIELTLRYLRAQTVWAAIEVILVGPPQPNVPKLEGCWGQQVLEMTAGSIGHANAAGIAAARAEIVALAEDHCFPDRDWAEALIAAHRANHAAVGPVVRNANPATAISWCDFIIGYGFWMEPAEAGPRPFLPGHNSCYKKRVLLEYGDRLGSMMESETVMHFDLASRGYSLYLEPKARVAHTNFALMRSWFPIQYFAGRVFGAARSAAWPLPKRLLFGIASPLIPLVRMARCLRELRRPGRPARRIPRLFFPLLAGLILDGLGQMMGYVFGAGNAAHRVAFYEFNRFDHVPASDRQEAEERAPR
jgi:hypothetical protein